MLKEADLNHERNTRGFDNLKKAYILLKYLYIGKTFEWNGRKIRMDGDYNVYMVDITTKEHEQCDFPIIINDMFYQNFTEISEGISNEIIKNMEIDIGVAKVLRGIK